MYRFIPYVGWILNVTSDPAESSWLSKMNLNHMLQTLQYKQTQACL